MPSVVMNTNIGSSSNTYLEQFKSNANEAINLKLVRHREDINEDETSFHPEYTHQLYGESESIFGYVGLKVQLFYSAGKLTTYLNYIFDEKLQPEMGGGIKADDALKPIVENIPSQYCSNLDEFEKQIDTDKDFVPFGTMLTRFSVKDRDGIAHEYEVYRGSVLTPGLIEYHSRLQIFMLWCVDGASYIDTDDDKWTFYFLFEKFLDNGSCRYAITGYCTVYNYYAYPRNTRPRISQMLILPPFQGLGLGGKLLQSIYDDIIATNGDNIIDITVEDPSEEFQRLRDFIDCRNCIELESFGCKNLVGGFNTNMINEAKRVLKLNKRQARRVYEILRLKNSNQADDATMKQYRLEVKRRLNAPYQKKEAEEKRLKKYLSDEELAQTVGVLDRTERFKQLEVMYSELFDNYMKVVKRLENIVELL